MRGYGRGVRLPALGAGRRRRPGGGRDDGQRRGHAPAARGTHVHDAAAAGRRPLLGRAAGRADRVRAGDLRPVRVRPRPRTASPPTSTRPAYGCPCRRARTTYGCGYADPAEVARRVRGGVRAPVPERPGMLARRPGWERLDAARPDRRPGRGRRRCSAWSPSGPGRRGRRVRAVPRSSPTGSRAGPEGGRALSDARRAGPGRVRRAVAVPLRHRPDVDASSPTGARGRPAAAPGHGRPPVRAAGAGRAVRTARGRRRGAARRGPTRRRWTWCSRSRTPSARGTRGAGG